MIVQAYSERRATVLRNMERSFPNGESRYLDVIVTPLYDEANNALGVAISYLDVSPYYQLKEELQRSREEVHTFKEELDSSNEELETTNEELQSDNEELQTTNQELKSTNEELQTKNVELQSSNAELQTVNEELRRTNELNHDFLRSVVS